jgi:hypothetical protein
VRSKLDIWLPHRAGRSLGLFEFPAGQCEHGRTGAQLRDRQSSRPPRQDLALLNRCRHERGQDLETPFARRVFDRQVLRGVLEVGKPCPASPAR